jgi:hypothetical protein
MTNLALLYFFESTIKNDKLLVDINVEVKYLFNYSI